MGKSIRHISVNYKINSYKFTKPSTYIVKDLSVKFFIFQHRPGGVKPVHGLVDVISLFRSELGLPVVQQTLTEVVLPAGAVETPLGGLRNHCNAEDDTLITNKKGVSTLN